MTVGELKERLKLYDDDIKVVIFFSEDDSFYVNASRAQTGYIGESVDQMFFDPDDFMEEDYDGVGEFDGELEEVFVVC